jgi:DNA repair exonuclease SbcCD ATPase subunit
MRTLTLFRLFVFASLAALLAFPMLAQDQQNSDDVAAAARKSREQAKNAPKPKKVVTNDDIPHAPDTTPAPAADSTAPKPEGQAAATTDKASADDEKAEAYWRKRFQEVHDKINNAQKELDVMQRELNQDQLQYYPDPQKAMMQQHDRSDINDKAAKIDAKKKEIESLTQQLSDMEDELRKAGGDPGWAR